MPIITCENLSLAYGNVPVVHDLSFSLEKGAYLAIIGANGSGKTTLFKGLIGLLPPLRGRIIINSEEAGRIGYLPQADGIPAHFPASVREVVQSGLLNRRHHLPLLRSEDKAVARRNLERLDMADYADRPFQALSGGQRQRVLIARALTASDRLLFLDEPTAGLDPDAERDLYGLLARLNREDGVTIVTISHDLTAVRDFASHVLVMQNGTMRFYGTLAEWGKLDGNACICPQHGGFI